MNPALWGMSDLAEGTSVGQKIYFRDETTLVLQAWYLYLKHGDLKSGQGKIRITTTNFYF